MVFAGTDLLTTGQRHILRHATNLAGYPSKTEGHIQTAVKHSRLSMDWTVLNLEIIFQRTMVTVGQIHIVFSYHNHVLMLIGNILTSLMPLMCGISYLFLLCKHLALNQDY